MPPNNLQPARHPASPATPSDSDVQQASPLTPSNPGNAEQTSFPASPSTGIAQPDLPISPTEETPQQADTPLFLITRTLASPLGELRRQRLAEFAIIAREWSDFRTEGERASDKKARRRWCYRSRYRKKQMAKMAQKEREDFKRYLRGWLAAGSGLEQIRQNVQAYRFDEILDGEAYQIAEEEFDKASRLNGRR